MEAALAGAAVIGALALSVLCSSLGAPSARPAQLGPKQRWSSSGSRLEALGDLVKELGEMDIMGGRPGLARIRIMAGLNATNVHLPACRALATADDGADRSDLAVKGLAEIANALHDMDPQPSGQRITLTD